MHSRTVGGSVETDTISSLNQNNLSCEYVPGSGGMPSSIMAASHKGQTMYSCSSAAGWPRGTYTSRPQSARAVWPGRSRQLGTIWAVVSCFGWVSVFIVCPWLCVFLLFFVPQWPQRPQSGVAGGRKTYKKHSQLDFLVGCLDSPDASAGRSAGAQLMLNCPSGFAKRRGDDVELFCQVVRGFWRLFPRL